MFLKMVSDLQSMFLVVNNGMILQRIKNQTEDICLLAVKECGLALEFVEHKTKKIISTALHQNGLALEFVVDQTERQCIKAIR
jgi:hypothetical protein